MTVKTHKVEIVLPVTEEEVIDRESLRHTYEVGFLKIPFLKAMECIENKKHVYIKDNQGNFERVYPDDMFVKHRIYSTRHLLRADYYLKVT